MDKRSVARHVGRLSAVATLVGTLNLLTPATAFASIPIVFELTGTFTEGVQVGWFGPNDEPETAINSGLPWSTAFDYNGNMKSLSFSGVHMGDEPGSVTCRVSMGGKTIVTHTNNAPPNSGRGAQCVVVNMGKGYVGI